MSRAAGGKKFDKMMVKRVYFGNWLRDYCTFHPVHHLHLLYLHHLHHHLRLHHQGYTFFIITFIFIIRDTPSSSWIHLLHHHLHLHHLHLHHQGYTFTFTSFTNSPLLAQAIDVGTVKYVSAEAIRILLWVLGFMTFGYGTREFEVTTDRLGCYRPEDHIDNPKDYADNLDATQYDTRLRGPVDERVELAVDPQTGLKNYIANERAGIMTSALHVRQLFTKCIQLGRSYGRSRNKDELYESMRLLGTALHCLEGKFLVRDERQEEKRQEEARREKRREKRQEEKRQEEKRREETRREEKRRDKKRRDQERREETRREERHLDLIS
jgi:hypothetical protein